MLVALGFVLSGCVAEGEGAGNGNGVVQPTGEISDTKGGIQGVVLNEELGPIPGAQVGITTLTLVATTDEAGRFEIAGLDPGSHVLSVIALGFQSKSQSVDVAAGGYAQTQFILTKLPTVGPYHTTTVFKNIVGGAMIKTTPDCMFTPNPTGGGSSTTKTCQGAVTQCEPGPCEVGYGHCGDGPFGDYGCDLGPEWATIIAEVQWTPTSSVTGRGFLLEVLMPNVTRSSGHTGSVDQQDPHDWMHLDSAGPLRTVLDRDVLAGNKEAWPGSGLRTIPEENWCGGIAEEIAPGACDFHWRLFPAWCTIHGISGGAAGCNESGPDFAASQDQPAELYFTYFMREPAPADWSALPDA